MLLQPLHTCLVTARELSIFFYNIKNSIIIVSFNNRTYRTGNNCCGSTCSHNGGDSLINFLGSLNLLLGKFGIILNLVDNLHYGWSSSWGRCHHLFLMCDRNHILFHFEIVNLAFFNNFHLTLGVLEGNKHKSQGQYVTNKDIGGFLPLQFFVHSFVSIHNIYFSCF